MDGCVYEFIPSILFTATPHPLRTAWDVSFHRQRGGPHTHHAQHNPQARGMEGPRSPCQLSQVSSGTDSSMFEPTIYRKAILDREIYIYVASSISSIFMYMPFSFIRTH